MASFVGNESEIVTSADYLNTTTEANMKTKGNVLDSLHPSVFIFVSTVIVFGSIGNAMSAVIMMRNKFRSTSTGSYLLAMAFVDTIRLFCNSLFRRWFGAVTGIQFSLISVFGCQIYVFFLVLSYSLSAWLVMVVCIERAIAVIWPLKIKALMTKKRSWQIILGLILLHIITSAPVAAIHTIKPSPRGTGPICYYNHSISKYFTFILGVLFQLFSSTIPCVCLVICSIILAIKLNASSRFQSAASSSHDDGKLRRLSIMVLFNSIVFVFLSFPYSTFELYVNIKGNAIGLYDVYIGLMCLELVNHAINWLVYIVSGPLFRNELIKLLQCGRKDEQSKPKIKGISDQIFDGLKEQKVVGSETFTTALEGDSSVHM